MNFILGRARALLADPRIDIDRAAAGNQLSQKGESHVWKGTARDQTALQRCTNSTACAYSYAWLCDPGSCTCVLADASGRDASRALDQVDEVAMTQTFQLSTRWSCSCGGRAFCTVSVARSKQLVC
jgi:hypothetical protein